jgi:ketosteroid isomerase-like protein
MKTIAIFFILAAMLLITGCNPEAETNNDMVLADSLLKVNESAYNSGDAQIIANLFADDALIIVNGKSTWSKDSIYLVAKSLASVIRNFRAYLGPVSVSKDIIQMQKYFTADITGGEAVVKGKGLAIIIWEKQADNSWKVVLEVEDYSIK